MNTKDLFFNSKEFQNIINGQENMFNNKISNINDSDLVDKLKKIHNARLSGIIPDFTCSTDDFDWEKNIEVDLLDYISDFDKYYFSEEYINNIKSSNLDKFVIGIINNLKECMEGINLINKNEINNPKKIMIQLYKFEYKYIDEKIKLQYIFLLNKLTKFLETIYKVYPNLLTIDIQEKLSESIGFKKFIQIFISNIKNSLINHINNIVKKSNQNIQNNRNNRNNQNNRNKRNKRNNQNNQNNRIKIELFNLLSNLDKNIKILFWIVYFEDIKCVDSIFKNYDLPDTTELENKIISSSEYISKKWDNVFYEIDINLINFIAYIKGVINKNYKHKFLNQEELLTIIEKHTEIFIENIYDSDDDKSLFTYTIEEDTGTILTHLALDQTINFLNGSQKKK